METIINRGFVQQNKTRLNNSLNESYFKNLEGSSVLDGRYSLLRRLDTVSGEADLYTCSSAAGYLYVAKIYRRKDAVKSDVLRTLLKLDSPYIAKIYDYGELNGYPLVILPFFKNGSLADKKCNCDFIINIVIPSVNQALRYLHENGIIHKDIKPSNLMISDGGERIEVIDFGISSVKNDGQSLLITRTGMSPEYSAPETFSNVFLNESDYYSLGITLYELFTGHTPFSKAGGTLSEDELAASASVQNIPFPESMAFPERLKLLIKGLTYRDLSHRNEPDNPNRRWVFGDVERWMKGENMSAPGEAGISYSFKSAEYSNGNVIFSQTYNFKNSDGNLLHIQNLSDFIRVFGTNWNEGKTDVRRELVTKFFVDQGVQNIANSVIDCREAGITDESYSKMLMHMSFDIGRPLFYWNNKIMNSAKEVFFDLNETVLSGNQTQTELEIEYSHILKVLRYWFELKHEYKWISAIDRIAKLADINSFDLKNRIILFCAYLKIEIRIKIGEFFFDNISDFVKYASSIKNENCLLYLRWIVDNQYDIKSYHANYCRVCSKYYGYMDIIFSDLNSELGRLKAEREDRDRRNRISLSRNQNCSIVEFGRYYNHDNANKEPVEWRVLTKNDGCALLITDKAVDCKFFHMYKGISVWDKCSLRQWLNNKFLTECFDSDERKIILKNRISNDDGGDTDDYIFLLSREEAENYFNDRDDRICESTLFARNKHHKLYGNGYCNWWLRSSGHSANSALVVSDEGEINHIGFFLNASDIYVRPAVWIKLELLK